MRRLFVLALSLTILLPLLALLLAFAAASSQAQCSGGAVGPSSAPGVPSNLLAIYEQAAGSNQLGPSGWAYLAAINEIETDFGQDLSTSTAGAIGWMQFTPATWARYQVSADPTKPAAPPNPYDPWDAIFTAARYLHASGAPGDWPTALYAYNHAGWYVAQVQQLAQHYAQTAGSPVSATGGVPQPGCVTAGPATPGPTAQILPDGLAAVPQDAPAQVQAAIAAGNRIIDTSYSTERQPNMLSTVMGSYDCSGSTDFVLYNAGLNTPQVDVGNRIAGDSTLLETYGDPGVGQWITVYASANHAFIQIAGIVLDTAHWTPTTPPGSGPRWQPVSTLPSQLADGNTWTERHPPRTMRRPSARALKRSLLAAVCVLTIASTAVQRAATRTGNHTVAAARTGSAAVIADPTRSPPSAPSAQPRTVAATVAQAYARYLDGQLPAQRLPALTPQALTTARNSGPLPPRLHVTQVRLTSLTGDGDSWTAHYAIIDTHGRQTTTAQLVLSATDGPWKLAELIPPDPDILITPNPPALPPTGPAAARRAALEFTHSYLAYTYDHPAAGQLRDLTPTLRAAITANPPRVPAAVRALQPRIASLALTRDGARWLAGANVTDGHNTYQVTSVLAHVHGEWLIVTLRSAG